MYTEVFHCIQKCPHFSGAWSKGVPLYTEVSSFQINRLGLIPHFYPPIQVLSSLHSILLSLPPASNQSSQLYRQTAHGLNELIHTHTSTLTTTQHWAIIFNVLEFTGFGMISDLPEDKQTPLFDVMNSFDSLDVDQLPDHEPQVSSCIYCHRYSSWEFYFYNNIQAITMYSHS